MRNKKIIICLVLGLCCTGCTTDTTNRQELEPNSNTVVTTTESPESTTEQKKDIILTKKQLDRIKDKIKEYYNGINLKIEKMTQVDFVPTLPKEYEGYLSSEIIFFEVEVRGDEVNRGIVLGSHDTWSSCEVLNEEY